MMIKGLLKIPLLPGKTLKGITWLNVYQNYRQDLTQGYINRIYIFNLKPLLNKILWSVPYIFGYNRHLNPVYINYHI